MLQGAIRLGERVLRTDLRYLIRGGFWLFLGPVLTTGTALVWSSAMSRVLSEDEVGRYRALLNYAAILAGLSLSGMATSVTQAVARGHEGALRDGLRTSMRWGVVVGLLHVPVAAVLSFVLGKTTIPWGLVVAGALFPLSGSAPLYAAYLNGKKSFRGASLLPAYASMGTTLVLLAVLAIWPRVLLLAILYFVGLTAFHLLFLWITLRLHRPPATSPVEAGSTRYGVHLSIMDWLGAFAQHLDSLVAFHYLGEAALAVYYFGVAIPEQMRGTVKGLHFLVLPKFAARSTAEIRAAILGKFLWLALFLGAIVGAYALVAPTLLGLLFPDYPASVHLSQLYALVLLNYISLPAGTFLAAKQKVREQYVVNISMSLLQIALTFVLVVPWHLVGLVWAKVIRAILGAALIIVLFYRCSRSE